MKNKICYLSETPNEIIKIIALNMIYDGGNIYIK